LGKVLQVQLVRAMLVDDQMVMVEVTGLAAVEEAQAESELTLLQLILEVMVGLD
jgi:hypothetical protein